MRPINPVLPLFYARCCVCGHQGDSLNMAAGDEPFTYVCSMHQDDATREAVRRNTNEQFARFRREQPSWCAAARRSLGIKRPSHLPPSPDWDGCGVDY